MNLRYRLSKQIRQPQSGQGLIEYALLLALIAVALVGIVLSLGPAVNNTFNSARTNVSPDQITDYTPAVPAPLNAVPPLPPVPVRPTSTIPPPTVTSYIPDQSLDMIVAYVDVAASGA